MWTYIAGSVRGTSHEKTGQRLQDAHRCFVADDYLVAIACDGAGSSSHGGEGASLAARRISSLALAHVREHRILPCDAKIRDWIDETRDLIAQAAASRGLGLRDFATTLVLALASRDELLCAHIGDGAIAVRENESSAWTSVSWPEHGEYASTTYFLTDDTEPRLRISSTAVAFDTLVLMTDGLERLALDFALRSPHGPFLDVMAAPLRGLAPGRPATINRALSTYLQSATVNARTDDDKTLIVAVRT